MKRFAEPDPYRERKTPRVFDGPGPMHGPGGRGAPEHPPRLHEGPYGEPPPYEGGPPPGRGRPYPHPHDYAPEFAPPEYPGPEYPPGPGPVPPPHGVPPYPEDRRERRPMLPPVMAPLAEEPLMLVELPVKKQVASAVLGTGGSNASKIRKASRCKLHIRREKLADDMQIVELSGTAEEISTAVNMIKEIAAEVDSQLHVSGPSSCRATLEVLPAMVGCILGSKGGTVKLIKQKTGANIHIEDPDPMHATQLVDITGSMQQVKEGYSFVRSILEKFDMSKVKMVPRSMPMGPGNPMAGAPWDDPYADHGPSLRSVPPPAYLHDRRGPPPLHMMGGPHIGTPVDPREPPPPMDPRLPPPMDPRGPPPPRSDRGPPGSDWDYPPADRCRGQPPPANGAAPGEPYRGAPPPLDPRYRNGADERNGQEPPPPLRDYRGPVGGPAVPPGFGDASSSARGPRGVPAAGGSGSAAPPSLQQGGKPAAAAPPQILVLQPDGTYKPAHVVLYNTQAAQQSQAGAAAAHQQQQQQQQQRPGATAAGMAPAAGAPAASAQAGGVGQSGLSLQQLAALQQQLTALTSSLQQQQQGQQGQQGQSSSPAVATQAAGQMAYSVPAGLLEALRSSAAAGGATPGTDSNTAANMYQPQAQQPQAATGCTGQGGQGAQAASNVAVAGYSSASGYNNAGQYGTPSSVPGSYASASYATPAPTYTTAPASTYHAATGAAAPAATTAGTASYQTLSQPQVQAQYQPGTAQQSWQTGNGYFSGQDASGQQTYPDY